MLIPFPWRCGLMVLALDCGAGGPRFESWSPLFFRERPSKRGRRNGDEEVISSSWAGFRQRYTNRSQIILLTAWGHLEPGCVSVPLEIRSIFSESLPLKLKLYLVLLLLSLCTINLLCSIFICVSFYICM